MKNIFFFMIGLLFLSACTKMYGSTTLSFNHTILTNGSQYITINEEDWQEPTLRKEEEYDCFDLLQFCQEKNIQTNCSNIYIECVINLKGNVQLDCGSSYQVKIDEYCDKGVCVKGNSEFWQINETKIKTKYPEDNYTQIGDYVLCKGTQSGLILLNEKLIVDENKRMLNQVKSSPYSEDVYCEFYSVGVYKNEPKR